MTVFRAVTPEDLSDLSDSEDDTDHSYTLIRATQTELVFFQNDTRETWYFSGNFVPGGYISGASSYGPSNNFEGSLTGFRLPINDIENMNFEQFVRLVLAGDDQLYGSNYNDTLIGLTGNDLIQGGEGVDLIYSNQDNDTVDGGGSDDTIFGGQGADSLTGGEGADNVTGNRENDVLSGAAGNDTLTGNLGNDLLAGEAGDDWLSGQRENDSLSGGEGADVFVFFSEGGADVVTDFQKGADKIAIALNINNSGIAGFAGLSITEAGGSAVIHLGGSDQVTLSGIAPASLDASDVTFF